MIISIDFDNTYTVDMVLWDSFAKFAMNRKFKVICVTARSKQSMEAVYNSIGKVIGIENCFYTNFQPKRQFMKSQHNIDVDIWIDDMPEMIISNDSRNGLIYI